MNYICNSYIDTFIMHIKRLNLYKFYVILYLNIYGLIIYIIFFFFLYIYS